MKLTPRLRGVSTTAFRYVPAGGNDLPVLTCSRTHATVRAREEAGSQRPPVPHGQMHAGIRWGKQHFRRLV